MHAVMQYIASYNVLHVAPRCFCAKFSARDCRENDHKQTLGDDDDKATSAKKLYFRENHKKPGFIIYTVSLAIACSYIPSLPLCCYICSKNIIVVGSLFNPAGSECMEEIMQVFSHTLLTYLLGFILNFGYSHIKSRN